MTAAVTIGADQTLAQADAASPAFGRTRPVGLGFLTSYTVAQIGAFIAFVPLLQILAPLKAAGIDPIHKTAVLSQAMFFGAIAASVANLLAGAASDRTRSRFGRRRPWMAIGLAGTLVSYVVIAKANTATALVVGVVLFQSLFNCFFAAFGAVAADRTPDAQKGLLSSLLSLGLPIGSAIGVFVVGGLILDCGARYTALGMMVAAAILPFLLFQRDPTAAQDANSSVLPQQDWRPRSRSDFMLALGGRVLTLTSHALLQGFGLFLLQDRWSHLRGAPAQIRPEQALALLLAGSTCVHIAAALFSGWLSDRVGRRKPFIILGAIGSGAAIACAAVAQDWNGMIAAFMVFGVAAGCYCAVDSALMLQVLPSLETAGRDLGVVNLTNTIPQALAPMLAVAVVHQGHTAYGPLLLIGAAVATAGAATIIPIRNVR